MNKIYTKKLTALSGVFLVGSCFGDGVPLWTFKPLTPTTQNVPSTSNSTVKYLVTNQSKKTHTLVLPNIPSGVVQDTISSGSCSAQFTLGYQQSCILSLNISGSSIRERIENGPDICQQNPNGTPNPNLCYRPSKNDQLHIASLPSILLFPVSCAGSNCATLGFYTNNQGEQALLGYFSRDNGLSWSLSNAGKLPLLPLPSDAISNSQSLIAPMSCVDTSCTAVATYENASGNIVPSAYFSNDNGATWSLSNSGNLPILPLPSDVVGGAGNTNGPVAGVSCFGTRCVAAGYYVSSNSGGAVIPLAYVSMNGGRSYILSSDYNNNPFPLPSDSYTTYLDGGVSCNGSNCVAVGLYYSSNASSFVPLVYYSNNSGTNWNLSNSGTIPLLPLPTDATSINSNTASLNDVSCVGLNCAAVGSYSNTSGGTSPLAYFSSNGGASWVLSNAEAPISLPGDTAAGGAQNVTLNQVSCVGQSCSVTGDYINTDGRTAPLAYVSNNNGLTWVLANSGKLPLFSLPGDAATGNNLASVLEDSVCTNKNCTAVGFYINTFGEQLSLGYVSNNNGLTWALTNSGKLPLFPLPVDATN